jgi:hypothetical protein
MPASSGPTKPVGLADVRPASDATVGNAPAVLVNSGPLSTTIRRGNERLRARCSRTRVTRRPDSPWSTSIARHSRLASSTMFSVRKVRPPARVSPMKSIDQRSFGCVGVARTMRATTVDRATPSASHARRWLTPNPSWRKPAARRRAAGVTIFSAPPP